MGLRCAGIWTGHVPARHCVLPARPAGFPGSLTCLVVAGSSGQLRSRDLPGCSCLGEACSAPTFLNTPESPQDDGAPTRFSVLGAIAWQRGGAPKRSMSLSSAPCHMVHAHSGGQGPESEHSLSWSPLCCPRGVHLEFSRVTSGTGLDKPPGPCGCCLGLAGTSCHFPLCCPSGPAFQGDDSKADRRSPCGGDPLQGDGRRRGRTQRPSPAHAPWGSGWSVPRAQAAPSGWPSGARCHQRWCGWAAAHPRAWLGG